MSEQMENLTSSMQEMMARMARMQAELDGLKAHGQKLPQSEEPTNPAVVPPFTSTRRKTLKRLGLALLGGAVAVTATGFSAAEAKIVAIQGTGKVGAIVLSPKALPPSGNADTSYQYGLVGLARSDTTTAFNLTTDLPTGDMGVFGSGYYGVYGKGTYGVIAMGSYGGMYGFGPNYGVYGDGTAKGVYGTGSSYGIYGESTGSTSGTYGVYGKGYNGICGIGTGTGTPSNNGVYGEGVIGIYGKGSYLAGFFAGNVTTSGTLSATTVSTGTLSAGGSISASSITASSISISGTVSAGSISVSGNVSAGGTVSASSIISSGYKNFKIDHPLDPENKYLYHTSIESPDMKNLYDGVVTLDEQGEATVKMPDWFEALNFDFRYQLTCLGEYSQVFIAEKMTNRRFKIAGGKSGQEISWQVTGIRQDAYAKAYPSPVEQEKTDKEKRLYLHPEAFGKSKELSVNSLYAPK